MRGMRTLILVAYIVIGIIVASNRNYLGGIDTLREILSAFLAIVLWPLVLLGVNLHLRG
jgi:ABC-type anion transport system duplicated permease subunit